MKPRYASKSTVIVHCLLWLTPQVLLGLEIPPLALAGGSPDKPAEDTLATLSVVVDLGKDVGQSFGSLFEVLDEQDRVVAGAGFMDVYNTRFRSGRHTLQFFVRPEEDANEFTIDRLAHPDLDCGVYLFDLNERLYAWSSVRNNSVRSWDSQSQQWKPEPSPKTGRLRSGDGIMRLGTGTLAFSNNQAAYNAQSILTPPRRGRYYSFYYAAGHLFFYHTHKEQPDVFTKIYACPWTADSPGPIDLSQAVVMDTKYVGETPFAYGQFEGSVLTVSNQGGVYVFDGSRWKTLLDADNTVSYQVYSMLNYHDRLLLAQYPTGYLFEYKGNELKLLKGWPPRLPGVSPRAREAQTLSIYRGDLFVGVWPWAEVWRYNADADKWHSMGRMFTHPEITNKTVHPYEAAAKKHGLVTNHWGQRVTAMVPLQDSLMLSTSSKGTSAWFDKYDFLTEAERREYGALIRLKMPGNLAARIEWCDRPTKLEFIIRTDRLIIRQDGKQLATSDLDLSKNTRDLKRLRVRWGQGVFGKLNGTLLSRSASFDERAKIP